LVISLQRTKEKQLKNLLGLCVAPFMLYFIYTVLIKSVSKSVRSDGVHLLIL